MQADSATRRALVVDDVPGVRSALTRELRNSGLQVFCAADERDAMRILSDHWVDVVVVEHRPPEFCGIDLLERVRRAHPHTHRVIITGQPTFSVMREAINRAGVSFILTKPWDSQALRDALRNLIGADLAPAVPLQNDRADPSPTSGLDGERAAVCAQRILAELNACGSEPQIRSLLLREFVRLTAADRFWWVDERDHMFLEFDSEGQILRAQSIDSLDGSSFDLVDRSRRASRPTVLAVGNERNSGAALAAPLRCRGRDLGVFGVSARRVALVSGIPLAVAAAVADGVAFALERAHCDELREHSLSASEAADPARCDAIDVETLVRETIDKMRRLSLPEAAFLVASDVGVSRLHTDRTRLERVLWQLLRSAKEVAGEGGVVRVSSRCRRRAGRPGVEISVEGEAPTARGGRAASSGRTAASAPDSAVRAQRQERSDSTVRGTCAAFWLPVARR